MKYDIHVLHVHRFVKQMANKSGEWNFSVQKYFSPEHNKGTYIMDVVSHSTMNANGGTVKTLKGKLKC